MHLFVISILFIPVAESDTDLDEEEHRHHQQQHQDIDGGRVLWIPLVNGDGGQAPHQRRVDGEGESDVPPQKGQLQEEVDDDNHGEEGESHTGSHRHRDTDVVDHEGVQHQHVCQSQPRQVDRQSVLNQDYQTYYVLPEKE